MSKTSKSAGAVKTSKKNTTNTSATRGAPSKAPKQKTGGAVSTQAPHVEGAKLFVNSHVANVSFTEKRPGVIAAIVGALNVAPENAPTKNELLDMLCGRFPERVREQMKSTLMMQVPSGLYIEKRIVVKSGARPDGAKTYYIDGAATAQAQAKRAEEKAQKAQQTQAMLALAGAKGAAK